MGTTQSIALRELAKAGPWSFSRPLPAPFTQRPLSAEARSTLKIVVLIASLASLALIGAIFFVVWATMRGKVRIDWRAIWLPSTTQSQMLILVTCLAVSQLLFCIGSLMGGIYLHNNAIVAPSLTCWTQGILLGTGGFVSHSSIAAIGCHAATCVFKLKPTRMSVFLLYPAGIWTASLAIGLCHPLLMSWLYSVPYIIAGHYGCYINFLYAKEFFYSTFLPFTMLFWIATISYPLAAYKLWLHSKTIANASYEPSRTRAKQASTRLVHVSVRMLSFPVVAMFLTIPFYIFSVCVLVNPHYFEHHNWPDLFARVMISITPIIDTVLFGTFYLQRTRQHPTITVPQTQYSSEDTTHHDSHFEHIGLRSQSVARSSRPSVDVTDVNNTDERDVSNAASVSAGGSSNAAEEGRLPRTPSLGWIRVEKTVRIVQRTSDDSNIAH